MDREQLDRTFGGPTVAGRARKPAKSHWFWAASETNLWCSRCHRTFPNGTYRKFGDVECCPYADCAAVVLNEASDWSGIRREHPNYPLLPWLGIQYPLIETIQKITG